MWVKKRRIAFAFRLTAAKRQFESFNRDARGKEFQGQCCKWLTGVTFIVHSWFTDIQEPPTKKKKFYAVESQGNTCQETPFTTITQNRSCGLKKTTRVSDNTHTRIKSHVHWFYYISFMGNLVKWLISKGRWHLLLWMRALSGANKLVNLQRILELFIFITTSRM